MAKYTVLLELTCWMTQSVYIEAESQQKARELALEREDAGKYANIWNLSDRESVIVVDSYEDPPTVAELLEDYQSIMESLEGDGQTWAKQIADVQRALKTLKEEASE